MTLKTEQNEKQMSFYWDIDKLKTRSAYRSRFFYI